MRQALYLSLIGLGMLGCSPIMSKQRVVIAIVKEANTIKVRRCYLVLDSGLYGGVTAVKLEDCETVEAN